MCRGAKPRARGFHGPVQFTEYPVKNEPEPKVDVVNKPRCCIAVAIAVTIKAVDRH